MKVKAVSGTVGVGIVRGEDSITISVKDECDFAIVVMTWQQAERLVKAIESQVGAIGARNFRKLVAK